MQSSEECARELGVDCTPSQLASLDEPALIRLARHIGKRADFGEYARSRWDDSKFWNVEDSLENRSQYFTVGNSINFRFWKLSGQTIEAARGWKGGERFGGSMYLWRSLRLCLEGGRYPILDASFLASLTEDEFDRIFSDDRGVNPLEVAKEDRIANLRDLGSSLVRDWQGKFYNVVLASKGSLATFVRLSSQFRAFDDSVFKLTMVNAILHSGSGVAQFDSEPLPGIDYHLLKQMLRHGVVRPRAGLAMKIEKREFLSLTEGRELRRITLCAFVRLSELTGISGEILDNKWWWNRTKCWDADPVCLDEATAHECPFYGACDQLTKLKFPMEETRYY